MVNFRQFLLKNGTVGARGIVAFKVRNVFVALGGWGNRSESRKLSITPTYLPPSLLAWTQTTLVMREGAVRKGKERVEPSVR